MYNEFNQFSLLKQYTDENRKPFNKKLIERNDDDNINALIDIIKSCERDKFFTIKLNNWYVIKDPIKIYEKLYQYEQNIINSKKKDKDSVNPMDYIYIKDSIINLLVVEYYIKVKDEEDTLEVLIKVPKYIDKYYFKLNGNYYIPLYQIVDGSTYNNTSKSKRKVDTVTDKSLIPIPVYKYINKLNTVDGEELDVVYYVSNTFDKHRAISIFKFILTKFGFIGTLEKSNLSGAIYMTDILPEDRKDIYVFNKNNIYICTPKVLFDNDYTLQSLVYTIIMSINKSDVTLEDLYSNKFWLCSGGLELNDFSEERGNKLIESIESLYDILTYKTLRLPEDKKKDVYDVLLWLIREFHSLMLKDNLNIQIKRLRISEYIASFYGAKLTKGIHLLSNAGKKIKVNTIKKHINIKPNFLITQLTRTNLVKYINVVDDSDSFQALSYTFKGVQGIGENKMNAISESQKRLHPTSMFILDSSTSNKSDPGMSGMLCPYAEIYDNGYFSDYQEPNSWDNTFGELFQSYKESLNLKEKVKLLDSLNINHNITNEDLMIAEDNIEKDRQLIEYCSNADNGELFEAIAIDL